MASVVPVKKKLMDVKIGAKVNRILMQDFTPKGSVGVFQRGYYQYYRYVTVKKGSMLLFLWCWQLTCFSTTTFPTRSSNISGYASTTEEGPRRTAHFAFLTMTFFAGHHSLKNSILLNYFLS